MLLPHTYEAALLLMVVSMLCWGSWANTLKLTPGYRFQLFYWDYAIGLAMGAAILGLTAGSHGPDPPSFLSDMVMSPPSSILLAACGGAVFNIANLLLVAAIDVAGLAVAFPVGIGLALVVVAIILDAAAYRRREETARATTTRGIVLSLIAGVLMGSFYPLVARAMGGADGAPGPGPYATAMFFAVGVLISTVPANLLLMAKPLDGKPPVSMSGYWDALNRWHFAGIFGGIVWCCGAVANFVASGAHQVGPAVSYAIGQGATMVSACWGVFVWKEFAGAPKAAKNLLALMFLFFVLGLTAVAL